VTIDDSILLRYIAEILGKPDLAIRLAIRHDLAGIERLYTEKFMALYNAGDYENAVVMAAKSPKVKTDDTICHTNNNLLYYIIMFIVTLIISY